MQFTFFTDQPEPTQMLLFDRNALWTRSLRRARLRVCVATNKHRSPQVSLDRAANANQAGHH